MRRHVLSSRYSQRFSAEHNRNIRENVHHVGSILFQTNFIITQLTKFYLHLQFLKKAANGGRNIDVSKTLLVV